MKFDRVFDVLILFHEALQKFLIATLNRLQFKLRYLSALLFEMVQLFCFLVQFDDFFHLQLQLARILINLPSHLFIEISNLFVNINLFTIRPLPCFFCRSLVQFQAANKCFSISRTV